MAYSTRKIVEMQLAEVVGQIEHGECFYNAEMMGELLEDINGLKEVCLAYRTEIYAEMEAEDND